MQFVKRKLTDKKLLYITETIRVQDSGMCEEVHRSVISEETREDGSRAGSSRQKEDEGGKRPATEEQPAGQNRSQAIEEGLHIKFSNKINTVTIF